MIHNKEQFAVSQAYARTTHAGGENGVKNLPWSLEREKNWFSGQVEKMIVCATACMNNAANDTQMMAKMWWWRQR